jgi:putative addiction module component (TIGR02574 family)
MPILDYKHLSPKERLDLIGEIWDSIEADHIPLTSAQVTELDRRAAMLDEDMKDARSADVMLSDLRRRHP